jgi:hypothetical protein
MQHRAGSGSRSRSKFIGHDRSKIQVGALQTLDSGGWRNGIMDLLTTIAIILLVLWLLGLVSSYTIGGFIHILLVLALIVILIRVLQGRRPIP